MGTNSGYRHPTRRIGAALLGLGLLLAACASEANDNLPTLRIVPGAAPAATVDDGGDANEQRSGEVAELTRLPIHYQYELADGVTLAAGERAVWRLEPPADLRAAATRLAAAVGLDDADITAGDDGSLRIGPADPSGSRGLWLDPRGHWSYWDSPDHRILECETPGRAPDGGGDDPVVQLPADGGCEPPPPPENVPSAADATSAARELFTALGLPGEIADVQATADEWGAWVHAALEVDGQPQGLLHVAAGYGGDGRLVSASGTLAEPVEVADYPTVDAETALRRLNEDAGRWGPTFTPLPLFDTGTAGMAADQPAVQRPADPPAPADGDAEPEVVTVTLVDVEPALTAVVDIDQVTWLVPAYRFRDADGAAWDVLALADGYIEFEQGGQDDAPAPLPDEGGAPDPGTDPATDPDGRAAEMEAVAAEVVGLGEEEAAEAIEAAGGAVRVVARDGEQFAVTEDYRTDRINLVVDDGVVTEATVG